MTTTFAQIRDRLNTSDATAQLIRDPENLAAMLTRVLALVEAAQRVERISEYDGKLMGRAVESMSTALADLESHGDIESSLPTAPPL